MSNETAITLAEVPQQIAPVRRSILTISESQVERIKTLAGMMAGSQLEYGKMKPGDIFIKMMKGLEIGLEPVASMDLIDVIQGKPTLKPQGMLALAWGSGLMQSLSITDDGTTCTVKMQRVGSPAHVETFSAKDADLMKTKEDGKMISLSQKFNWRGMPATMRKWRAVSAACRIVFPDIIQGMYIPEEISPDTIVNEGGEIVDAQYDDVAKQQEQPEALPKQREDPNPQLRQAEVVPEESPPEANEDRPAVYKVKCTHMCYVVNGQKYLGFANCEPGQHEDDPNLTIIRAYGRTTKVKQWLGDYAYKELNLDKYTGVTKTQVFEPMSIPVEFEYIEETTKKGETFLKAVGVVGNEPTAQELAPPPIDYDDIPF